MTPETYRQELEAAADSIRSRVERVSIGGSDADYFLVAEFAGRAVEIYRGGDGVYIDPALGDDLLGEVAFATYAEAIAAALQWLLDGSRPA